MRRSSDRILTTHTGSLPRPVDLDQLIADKDTGAAVDAGAFDKRVAEAVNDVVASQLAVGVSVVSDGEMGKSGYSTYVKDRLNGFGGTGRPLAVTEMIEYPEVFEHIAGDQAVGRMMNQPACDGPVSLRDPGAVHKDIENLKAAVKDAEPADVFMTAASPGVIAAFFVERLLPDRRGVHLRASRRDEARVRRDRRGRHRAAGRLPGSRDDQGHARQRRAD